MQAQSTRGTARTSERSPGCAASSPPGCSALVRPEHASSRRYRSLPSSRLLADAEAEDGAVARPHAAERFQVCPRETRGREANAVAEQHRQYIHQDLVDEFPL